MPRGHEPDLVLECDTEGAVLLKPCWGELTLPSPLLGSSAGAPGAWGGRGGSACARAAQGSASYDQRSTGQAKGSGSHHCVDRLSVPSEPG